MYFSNVTLFLHSSAVTRGDHAGNALVELNPWGLITALESAKMWVKSDLCFLPV